MARQNYSFQKRVKEQARKKKQEAKNQRRETQIPKQGGDDFQPAGDQDGIDEQNSGALEQS